MRWWGTALTSGAVLLRSGLGVARCDIVHQRIQDIFRLFAVDLTQRVYAIAELGFGNDRVWVLRGHMSVTVRFLYLSAIATRECNHPQHFGFNASINTQLVAQPFRGPCAVTQLQHG